MSTERDKTVLNLILNPLLPQANFGNLTNGATKLESDSVLYESLEHFDRCNCLEIEAVKLAEKHLYDEALIKLDYAIKLCPKNPSPYNNRAQIYQLEKRFDEAILDLEKAIELSDGRGNSALQAYIQRALIHQLHNESEQAKENYQKAANLGSAFAQTQLVAMNPYSAMCNQMLQNVMSKFQNPEENEDI